MQIYRIKTTAYEEEDLIILTDLLEQEISDVIEPLVESERNGTEGYDNEKLVKRLRSSYPKSTVKNLELIELVY
jgi:hypothetical protein